MNGRQFFLLQLRVLKTQHKYLKLGPLVPPLKSVNCTTGLFLIMAKAEKLNICQIRKGNFAKLLIKFVHSSLLKLIKYRFFYNHMTCSGS